MFLYIILFMNTIFSLKRAGQAFKKYSEFAKTKNPTEVGDLL